MSDHPGIETRLAYSVQELAQATSVSKQTLYQEIAAGRLRAVRVRNRILIPKAAVDAWLPQN